MRALERNLKLYPLYQALRNALFWLPVFFLFFQSALSAKEVLLLEAIYYAAVVVLEVPSGYFSDRVGRRLTLLLSAGAWTTGYLMFFLTESFLTFGIAQVLLAAGMAFNSGTDASILFDTLGELGRAGEYGDHEGRAQSLGYVALALSSLAGGLLAGVELRWAYAASAVFSVGSVVVAFLLREPARADAALPPMSQLRAVKARLGDGVLRWLFVYAVAMTVFEHVPYEYIQPYLEELLGQAQLGVVSAAPAASGVMLAAVMGVSAMASRRAMSLSRRFGPRRVLLGGMLLEGVMIAGMAAVLHPLILVLVLFRSVPPALERPVAGALLHPRLSGGLRATYLSVQSLSGRLAFAVTLAASSWIVGARDQMTHAVMAPLLAGYAAILALVFLWLWLTAPREACARGANG